MKHDRLHLYLTLSKLLNKIDQPSTCYIAVYYLHLLTQIYHDV
jgi:hypothetical protein